MPIGAEAQGGRWAVNTTIVDALLKGICIWASLRILMTVIHYR
jgi:hypothetical protein